MNLPLSDEEYLKHAMNGIRPACDSDDVETTGGLEADGNIVWQENQCNSCWATWNDAYNLTGYYDLEDRNGEKILRMVVVSKPLTERVSDAQ